MKPQAVIDYGFTGVHIPPNIWMSKRVKRNEILVLMEISALSQGRPCTASNQFLADHLDLEPRRIQQIIAKLIRLGLVAREVSGPFRHMWADPVAIAAFDRESTMQKIACLPCNKFHGYHAINCTQVEKEKIEVERSPSENVEKGENPPEPDSAPLVCEKQEGREPPDGDSAPLVGADGTKEKPPEAVQATDADLNDGAESGGNGNCRKPTKTPRNAPWNGKKYGRAKVPRVKTYEELEAVLDPIIAAMAVTGDRKPGGFGFWIRTLNRVCANGLEVDMAVRVFRRCVEIIHGQKTAGELKNPAAAFNNEIKKAFFVEALA
ncbi:MAG: MarR family transcriptional regulator [Kiritimatiellales bacterium]|nr:MarR family transcriptional regulator [Kiritimatiellales bacterium]